MRLSFSSSPQTPLLSIASHARGSSHVPQCSALWASQFAPCCLAQPSPISLSLRKALWSKESPPDPILLTTSEHPRCGEATRAGSSMCHGSGWHWASGLHCYVCPFSCHWAGQGSPGFLLLLLHSQFLPQICTRERIQIKPLHWVMGMEMWKGVSNRHSSRKRSIRVRNSS